jgi:predicted AlkP superfamily phosphohydrolase/phosphomutase
MSSYAAVAPAGRAQRRVLIIGIDGATFDQINPLAAAGRLPNLQRLMQQGCWGPLRSTIPPVTAPAWSSFMTSVNPGRHGVYDFRYRRPDSYDVLTNNTTTNQAPMLWEILSAYGKRCCVLNVPATYPPRPINGVTVTGLLTPADAEIFTHPPELTAEIKAAIPDYAVWPPSVFYPKGREREFLKAVHDLMERRLDLFRFMQKRGDWDFQMLVFMGVDQVQHGLWHYQDPSHRDYIAGAPAELRDAIADCYTHVDTLVGQMLEDVGDETTVFVVSDHGFGPLEDWFHINTWLLHEGLLKLKPTALSRLKRLLFELGVTPLNMYDLSLKLKLGKTMAKTTRNRREWSFAMLQRFFLSFADVDWSRTVAYSLGNVGPIYINRADREPQGIVRPEDYEATLQMVAGRLRSIVDPYTHKPLVQELHFGKDIFHGEQARFGPDIMIFMRDYRVCAYGNNEFASRRMLTPAIGRTGWHRMDGVFIAAGPAIKAGGLRVEGSRLWDISPTVMAVLGVPLPADLDGRVLQSVLDAGALQEVQYSAKTVAEFCQGQSAGFSAEEEEVVARRLKGLGYV